MAPRPRQAVSTSSNAQARRGTNNTQEAIHMTIPILAIILTMAIVMAANLAPATRPYCKIILDGAIILLAGIGLASLLVWGLA